MKLTYRLFMLVALMLFVSVRVQAQQKEESRVDKLVRKHGGSHEEHDRACHEAIQAALAKKHKINPYSHHYEKDVMQLQPLRHEVEDECALFEYVSTEDRHELISFMAVAQSRDPRPSALKCETEYSCAPLKSGRKYNRAAGKLEAAQ
jgi:Na+-transporting methylmalonyl-CoA/oxaloacetate decarboxylase gamma subunit